MANDLTGADCFELKGPAHVTIDLRTGVFHYRGPTRPPLRDFLEVSALVSPLDTPIGRMVTVTLRAAADGDTSTVTVLLPEVNLTVAGAEGVAEVAFDTVAVFTTSRSTIGGPQLVEGPVQLYTHAAMEGTARRGGPSCSCVLTASLNRGLPGPDAGPAVLRVEGECTFGTTGFEVELVRHEPQGDPRELLLDLIVTPPPEDVFVGQAFTKYPVAYEEETTADVATVTILPDGPTLDVEVIT